jgi:hypothetical protein
VLYLTTHRQNTIDRVSMNPAANSGFTQSVARDPVYGGTDRTNLRNLGVRRRRIWPFGLFPLGWWHCVPTARWYVPARQGFARAILGQLAIRCAVAFSQGPRLD